MVGIGGDVPFSLDVRLGGVIVSISNDYSRDVIPYDFGEIEEGGKFRQTRKLNGPSIEVLNAIIHLQASTSSQRDIKPHLEKMEQCDQRLAYPVSQSDQLFDASYNHEDKKGPCENCDKHRLITDRHLRGSIVPFIHYGAIGSGSRIIKNGVSRDHSAKEHNLLCFEMEADGLMNDFDCLMIRGILDYADSHKMDSWQDYAAAIAAAYAKVLLGFILSLEVEQMLVNDLMMDSYLTDISEIHAVVGAHQSLSDHHPCFAIQKLCLI